MVLSPYFQAHDIGDDVLEDDFLFAHAEGLGRGDVLLLALGEDLRTDQVADARPGQDAQHDHDEVHPLFDGDARAEDGGEDHGKRQERQAAHDLGEAHDDIVDPAAEVAGEAAEDDADDQLDDDGDGADGHGDLAAVDEAVKHVAEIGRASCRERV